MVNYRFPPDFIWGAATASYQIEGGANEDGRGESVWDRFAHTPGKVFEGDTGDVATDHYHRYQEDVQLMRQLGLKAYRFSVAWPRILPDGIGPVNEAGLAFYDRLVDALLEAQIMPLLTLYHWDLPQALQDRQGGWMSRDIVEQFAHYAGIVSQRLGDRVKYWATFNEPRVFTTQGYGAERHAPGLGRPDVNAQVAHHVLLAHGTAVPIIRQHVGADAQVGIVYSLIPVEVEDETPELLARQRVADARINRWFVEPVLRGTYPAVLLETEEFANLKIEPGDMEIIHAPVDFVGVNYYTRNVLKADPATDRAAVPIRVQSGDHTAMGWEVYPQGFYNTLKNLNDNYAPPAIFVTENGAAYEDTISPDGRIHDEERINYLRQHLDMVGKAIQDGIPLKGYFVWSLLDNFEWAYGYSKRFGIIHVDYATGERRLKDSAYFYMDVVNH
jgi:beta-glucosidase